VTAHEGTLAGLVSAIEDIRPGDHLCLIYESDPAEQMPALVPYIWQGLQRRERCIYIADDQTTQDVVDALQRAGIDVLGAVDSGALLLWSREHWRQPGQLSPAAKSIQVREMIESALAGGFAGVRFAVEMTWTLGPDVDAESLRLWEAKINELFTPDVPASIVCQYSRRRLSPAAVRAGLATHPTAILGSKVTQNPYYEAPLILQQRSEAEQVDWMIDVLDRAAEAGETHRALSSATEAKLADAYREAARIAERLRDSEGDLRDVFENGPVALHSVGPDGVVLRVNRAELQMLGYEEHEVVGHHIAEFHVDREVIDDILARLASGETVHGCESEMRRKDGSTIQVLVDSSVLWRDGQFIHTRCFTRDVTERKASAEVASRLGAIIDSSDDAIVSKDVDGIVQSWNPGAGRVFGYTAEEMVGQSIRKLIPADRQHEEDDVVAAFRRGDRVDHYETVRVRKDGSLVDISLSVAPIRDARGRVVGASKIARDISLRKKADEAMARSLQIKDEFLSLVSHELRTPISIIVGNGEVLVRHRRNLTEEQTEQALEDVLAQGKRLQGIIENLLLLSRMERQERVPVEPVHLARLVGQSAEAFGRRLPTRTINVSLKGPTALGMGEPVFLTLVLDNLLANAHKYSPGDSPIDVEVVNPGDGTVSVHVLDRGIGLNDDELESVFTAFYRSPDAQAHASGMGLGLAVCERAMAAQAGSVSARQRPGGGSEFVMTLPAADPGV
jgi:hypothetical protein